ncbi:MAG: hypothetical protein H7338_19700 [Candidatus Sericytochromatia bacterium]|nr:hypothetical protein [Candidatus Sericytochromatia bacterium]
METFLYHPIAVHFPVVLLLGATFLLILLVAGRPVATLTSWVLGLGTFGAWVALYTGGLAEDHAEDVWHIPESLIEAHEQGAQITLALFISAFLVLTLGRRFQKRALYVLTLTIALAGSAALIYTSDLGGGIVYKNAIPAGSNTTARPVGGKDR